MQSDYRVSGTNPQAPFTLRIHRGEGMALLAMNWRGRRPTKDFVGFGIQYFPPGASKPKNVLNRLGFEGTPAFGQRQPSLKAPFQKFRWVHFPFEAGTPGNFRYVVTPVFMNGDDTLRYGEAQQAELELARETVPGALNVAFTRGFIASQAFVDNFGHDGDISTLIPNNADDGLDFSPTNPNAAAALRWMGFEARQMILDLLDEAIADAFTTVRVVAYDLSQADVVHRLQALGARLRIIIDNSGSHAPPGSGESKAADRLATSAGSDHVLRQHMGNLQHNKTILVTGPNLNKAICGSTNFSWRGFYVQNNNAVELTGKAVVQPFADAFDSYWDAEHAPFTTSGNTEWKTVPVPGLKVKVTFSPHSKQNAVLADLADDIRSGTTSSLLYSLAFLYQTKGAVRDAITTITEDPSIFVAGISDRAVGGINVQTPDGNVAPVHPEALSANVPAPFSAEPSGGGGVRMHHKFVVIDFDKPTARVYLGSYNFSNPADRDNGENLVLITDRRVATAYAIEAVRMFDHYQFRVLQSDSNTAVDQLALHRPPRTRAELAWFEDDYTLGHKILDRRLFA